MPVGACPHWGPASNRWRAAMWHYGHEKPKTENRTELTGTETEITEPIDFGSRILGTEINWVSSVPILG